MGHRIVLASNNPGKVREIGQLLADQDIEILPQNDFSVPEAEETGLTFVENAILKARNAAHFAGLPAIADDSGIEVNALNGAPGIYSARFAGAGASDADNLQKLLQELKEIPEENRSARFQCLMVYMRHENDPTPLICSGTKKTGSYPNPPEPLGSNRMRPSQVPWQINGVGSFSWRM